MEGNLREKEGKIKVVQIVSDGYLSGAAVHVLGVLKNLNKDKFEIYLICPRGFLSERAREIEGVNVRVFEFKSKFDFLGIWRLREILGDIQAKGVPFSPMIVHAHGPRAGLIGRMATTNSMHKVYSEHIWVHEYHLENRFLEFFQKIVTKRLNFRSDLVIAVSRAVYNFVVESKMAPKKRVKIIPNGIDVSDYKNKPQEARHRNLNRYAPVIGSVGNLNHQKGFFYLISAMKIVLERYPLATLEVVGEGEERGELLALTRELGLSRHVTFWGRQENPKRIMKNWDVYACSSKSETFGLSVLEAMAMGIPVVATKVGGIGEFVNNEKTGILVNAEDEEGLARGILEILAKPVLGAKFSVEGRKKAEEYDWKKVIKRFEEEYTNLINKQSAATRALDR